MCFRRLGLWAWNSPCIEHRTKKKRLRRSQGRLGAVLGPLEAMLEPSGGQKAPKMEPKRVPNRAPEATRAENGETLIFDDSTKDFNDFSCLRAAFWR